MSRAKLRRLDHKGIRGGGSFIWLTLLLAGGGSGFAAGAPRTPEAPFLFEPNRGQDASDAAYIANARGMRVGLQPGRLSFQFDKGRKPLRLDFVNAGRGGVFQAEDRLESESNYLMTPSVTHVPNFGRVTYRNLYPGIDATFYGRGDQMEYDLLLKAGASADQIRWEVNADKVQVDRDGSLRMEEGGHRLRLLPPRVYQVNGRGVRRAIDGRYRVIRRGQEAVVEFKLGAYDHRRELVIDPVLVWGEYLPAGNDFIMATDAQGDTYVEGYGGLQKFDTRGKLVYTATLGFGGVGITVDSTGRVYVVGSAGSGLPTTPNAFQSTISGSSAAYIAVFSSDGASLLYCSYLGGSVTAAASAVAVRTDGIAFVTGVTDSPDFPVSGNAYRKQLGPGIQIDCCDFDNNYGFVAKFDISQSGKQSLIYSTFIGPAPPIGIGVDAAGRAYVLQDKSYQQSFPTPGAFVFPGHFYVFDVGDGGYVLIYNSSFVTAFNLDGSALVYSAELGGVNPAKIAVDASGAAYVAATYVDHAFPITPGAYLTNYPEGVALKLTPNGAALAYSTYLGAPGADHPGDFSVDDVTLIPGCTSNCELLISGSLYSDKEQPPNFPLIAAIQGQDLPAKQTGFLVRLAGDGSSASFSSYFGSAGFTPLAIGADQFANIYVFDQNMENFPATQSPKGAMNPGPYLAKISPADGASGVASPNALNFGDIPVGVASESYFEVNPGIASKVSRTIQLNNFGSTPLTIDSVVPSGNEFSIVNGCPGNVVPAAGTCNMRIQFLPAAAGVRNGTIQINVNGNHPLIELYFKGYGTSGSYLEFSPAQLNFGDEAVGSQSAPQTITIRNAGDQPVEKVVLTTGTLDFPIQTNCPEPLPPLAGCQASVRFAPPLLGTYFSTMQRGVSSPGHSGQVTLTGTGTAPGAGGAGMLSVSATTLNFDPTSTGDISYQKFSFTNTSEVPVTVDGIVITPGNSDTSSGEFSVSADSCASSENAVGQFTVPVQGTCYVVLQFVPLTTGVKSASVTFASSTGASPAIALNGIARTRDATIGFLPTSVVFADTAVGAASYGEVGIANLGPERLLFDRIYATGDFSVDLNDASTSCLAFPLPPTPANGVLPDYYCSVLITFKPTAVGMRTGQLVTVTLTGDVATLPLSAIGVPAVTTIPPGALAISPDSLDFPPAPVGGASADGVDLSNEGTAPLTITAVTATGPFQATLAPGCTLPAVLTAYSVGRGTCTVNIMSTPTATGAQAGQLIVTSSAGQQMIPLSGIGLAVVNASQVFPSEGDFGNVAVGGSRSGAVAILNLGNSPLPFPQQPFEITGDGFSVDTNLFPVGYSVGANQAWIATLTFKPAKATSYTGSFTFTDARGNKQTIQLKGSGVTDAALTWPSAWALFYAGEGFFPQPVHFTNAGSSPLEVTSAKLTGSQSAFGETSTCSGKTLAPAAVCDAYIALKNKTPGYQLGNFALQDSNQTNYNLPLFSYMPPVMNSSGVGPEKLDFADDGPPAVVGSSVPAETASVTDYGTSNLTVGPIVVSGPFSIAPGTNQCSGVTIVWPAVQNCQVSFLFTPTQSGVSFGSAEFPITYADGSKITQSITLIGHAEAPRVGAAVMSPSSISYPALAEGYEIREDATLTNTGNVDLNLGSPMYVNVTDSYSGTADFYLLFANPCGTVLKGNSTCDLAVKFRPHRTGNLTGSITIPVYYPGKTAPTMSTVAFQGTGIASQPALTVSPGALQFGYESVGAPSTKAAEGTVVVTNTGNTRVSFAASSDTVSGPFVILSDGCAMQTPLASGSSCSIKLAFVPGASGDVTGWLTILSSAGKTPVTVSLSGSGLSSGQELAVSQATLAFGPQPDGTAGVVQTLYITNRGSVPTPGLHVSLTGANAADFLLVSAGPNCSAATLGGHLTCAISLRFKPDATSAGVRNAALQIGGLPVGGSTMIPLQGTAVMAP